LAGAAVQRDPVAFLDDMLADGALTGLFVDLDGAGARYAALAHASSHDGRVRGLAATGGEDSLRSVHPADVLRRGLQTDEDHVFAASGPFFGVVGVEDHAAHGCAG